MVINENLAKIHNVSFLLLLIALFIKRLLCHNTFIVMKCWLLCLRIVIYEP